MKKISCLFILTLLLSVLSCGCSKPAEAADADKDRVSMPLSDIYSNAGRIRVNTSKWIILFFDPVSGEEVPLCTRVNCPHNGEGCDACFPGVDFAAIIGDHLYYIEWSDGFQGKNLCVADPNGTNRRVLYHVEPAQHLVIAGAEDGYLFFTYSNIYDENGDELEKENCGLYLLDLKTEKLEHIQMPDDYESKISEVMISHGALYYQYSTFSVDKKTDSYMEWAKKLDTLEGWEYLWENTTLEIWKYDLSSGEKTCLLSRDANHTDALILEYGHLFGRVMNGRALDGKGHLENLNTGTVYTLEPELINNMSPCLCDEGVVLSDLQNRRFLLWRYDTGKLETLGSYEDDMQVSIVCITSDWVYAWLSTIPEPGANGEYIGEAYLSREQFMKGEYKWKTMPSYD